MAWHELFLIMVMEFKNTMRFSEDPVLQAVVDYSEISSHEKYECFREFCNFLTVLDHLAENRLDLSIAVSRGEIHVTKLLTLETSFGFLASDSIVRLIRVFVGLSSCRKALTHFTKTSEK